MYGPDGISFVISTEVPSDLTSLASVALNLLRDEPSPDQHEPWSSPSASPISILASDLVGCMPGDQYAVAPVSSRAARVFCLKTAVAKIYKALAGNQAKLAIQVPPVKEAITIGISFAYAQNAVSGALCSMLSAANWLALDNFQYFKIDSSMPMSSSKQFCIALSLSANIYQCRRLHMDCSIRTMIYNGIALEDLPIASLPTGANWQMLDPEIACCTLPTCRPCVVSAVSRHLPDIGPLQTYWEMEHGMKTFPSDISYFALVRRSADDTEPSFIYPSFCLCRLPGLTPYPSRPRWNMLVKEIQSLHELFKNQPFRLTGGILKVDPQLYQPTAPGPSARSAREETLGWGTSSMVQDTDVPTLPKAKAAPPPQLIPLPPLVMREEPPDPVMVREMLKSLFPAEDSALPVKRPPPPPKLICPQSTPGQTPKPPQLKARKQGGWMPTSQAAAKAAAPKPPAKTCVHNPLSQGPAKLPTAHNMAPARGKEPTVRMAGTPSGVEQGQTSNPEGPALGTERDSSTISLAPVPPLTLAAPGLKKRALGGAFAIGNPTASRGGHGAATQAAKKPVKKKAAAVGHVGPGLQAPTVSLLGGGPGQQQDGNGEGAQGAGGQPGQPVLEALAPQDGKVDAARAAPKKRARPADLDASSVEQKVKDLFAKNQEQKLSVNELKNFLTARKMPVGGKKGDLISRVQAHLAVAG